MTLVFALATYFIIWWIVLFAILPIGVRTQDEEDEISPGTAESAPQHPHLRPKLVATTLISAIVFAGVYAMVAHQLIALDDIPFLPRFEHIQ